MAIDFRPDLTGPPRDEESLLLRAQQGDRQAIATLFERYADALYGKVILPRVGVPAEAEDVLRETFLTLLEKIDQYTWRGIGLYGWLRRVAVNKIIDRARRRRREAPLPDEPDRLPASEDPTADQTFLEREDERHNKERVHATLSRINPRYAEAIRLRLLEELSREACAEKLGVTVGNFDVILHRALKAFEKTFTGEGAEPETA